MFNKKVFKDKFKALLKQGISDIWGYHFVEYGTPYKGVPDFHATGLGGLEEEGAFLVPNMDKVQVTQAPEGRIVTGTNKVVYDKRSLERSTFSIDDEWEELMRIFKERARRKKS